MNQQTLPEITRPDRSLHDLLRNGLSLVFVQTAVEAGIVASRCYDAMIPCIRIPNDKALGENYHAFKAFGAFGPGVLIAEVPHATVGIRFLAERVIWIGPEPLEGSPKYATFIQAMSRVIPWQRNRPGLADGMSESIVPARVVLARIQ